MVTTVDLSKMWPPMVRFVSLIAVAFAFAICAPVARAQDSTTELLTRIDRLEAALRQLTGSVEQLQYRNQQLEQQVRRLQDAVDAGHPASAASPSRPGGQSSLPPSAAPAPLGAVASAAPIEPSTPTPAPPAGRRSDVFDPTQNPSAPGAPRPLGTSTAATEPPPIYERPSASDAPGPAPVPRQTGAPLNLSTMSTPPGGAAPPGELPPPPPINPSATGAMQATLPPSNSPKDEYDLAYGYVLHKDYGLAAEAFRAFLRQYPSDRQAPEAQYWLGESLFQQQQYRDAAESFLAVSTKYDATARAPEALFRLGQSLAALGEKEAACASLAEVLRKYPRAPQNVKQSVEREQKRDHC